MAGLPPGVELRAKLISGQNVKINGRAQADGVPVSWWNTAIHDWQHVRVHPSHIVRGSLYTTAIPPPLPSPLTPPRPPRYKKGGKIPKSGLYKLHKGEVVVPAHRVKTVDKALKKSKRKPLKKVCKNCVLTTKQLKSRKK
jgi:hypothetical protein